MKKINELITVLKKKKRIPKFFLKNFNWQKYADVNIDIKFSQYSPKKHFILYGYDEVKNGKRRLSKEVPFFDENLYLRLNPDLALMKKTNEKFDAFNHFLEFGYFEFIHNKRLRIGYFPFDFNEKLQNKFKKIFDEKAYIQANVDVKDAIKEGLFKDGWSHFKEFGVFEVRRGERKIHPQIPQFSEIEYLSWFEDIRNAAKEGLNPFEHFLLYGYDEILKGKRVIPGLSIYCYYTPELTKEIKKEIENFKKKPLISIIMPVYNVEPKWLDLAIKSVENQWYDNWELCIADDASTNKETREYLKKINNPKIKIKFLEKNLGISGASNEALKLAKGDYIALMDNDDELTPDALYEVVKAINESGAEFIYSDEDKIEMNGTFVDPHFKPDFAPDMFLAQNYISHLGVIKRELVERVGGWEIGLEGSQDYDLYLKVLEYTDKIHHISKVLYHWRKIPGSTAAEYSQKSYAQEAGRKALENAMKRRNIKAIVKNGLTPGTYKIDYELKEEPLVSIIIPFKDKPELLRQCIESILNKTTYQNYEIIGISNNSEQKETFEEMKRLQTRDKRVKFYEYNVPFNYSEINNYAVKKYAKGKHIVLMNNDIEIITPSWIEEMLMFSQRDDVGAVGAKLYYPDDTIQHAGLVIAPYTAHGIINVFSRFEKSHYGYFSRLKCINNYNAVTAALLMIKKELFIKIGMFDEKKLPISYNDVDLCLRLSNNSYFNVWTPFVEAYHYESATRGYDNNLKKIERLRKELYFLKEKNKKFFLSYDKFYNPNLSLDKEDFSIHPINSLDRKKYLPKPFEEKVIINKQFKKNKSKKIITIFVHYDLNNIISDYVLYYLEDLSKYSDIIFISTADGMCEAELEKISKYCKSAIVKENIGYDFGAWKTGLNFLKNELYEYEALIMCNDSVFGPIKTLENVLKKMEKYEIWSMTDNFEIEYHLQSYFIFYKNKVFKSDFFKSFWNDMKIIEDKSELIKEYEIKYTKKLIDNFNFGVYYSAKNKSFLNIMHYYWRDMLENDFPFIKKELLLKNPLNINIKGWEQIIKRKNSLLYKLIVKYIQKGE